MLVIQNLYAKVKTSFPFLGTVLAGLRGTIESFLKGSRKNAKDNITAIDTLCTHPMILERQAPLQRQLVTLETMETGALQVALQQLERWVTAQL